MDLAIDGTILNQHIKCTTTLAEIMDYQVLALHVKFGRVKPFMPMATNVKNTLEKNDNTTIGIISLSKIMFSKFVVFNVLGHSMGNIDPIELLNIMS